jgi:hypothetical protein
MDRRVLTLSYEGFDAAVWAGCLKQGTTVRRIHAGQQTAQRFSFRRPWNETYRRHHTAQDEDEERPLVYLHFCAGRWQVRRSRA